MIGPGHIVRLASRAEREVRDVLTGVSLAALDAALDSRLAHAAADRVLASRLAAHVVDVALDGPLVTSAGPGIERIADRAVDSPAAERLVARVIEGRLLDEAVARLLESEDLWILVDEIARSPAVTDAISHQGVGLADEVGDVVRARSRRADARLEQVARRAIGRLRPGAPPAGPAPTEP